MIKKLLFTLYTLIIVCMGSATIIEKYMGTDYVSANIYGSWWFTLLWTMLAAVAVTWIIKRKMHNWLLLTLHASLLVILTGALLTHITSQRGMMHLRTGLSTNKYYVDNGENGIKESEFPFNVRLDKFNITYHAGTQAVADYTSCITVCDGGRYVSGTVSMNNIFSYKSVRFYQSSFDEDGQGSILAINSDPIGIPITYTGYGLLFLSLVLMLICKGGPYRKLLESQLVKRGAITLAAMTICVLSTSASQTRTATTLPKETASELGHVYILYNNRICPLQTFAIDFTKKLYGKNSYKGLTAEQVIAGWMFWSTEWCKEPIIRIKSGELKERLHLPDYMSIDDFHNGGVDDYIIEPYIREYYQGNQDALHKQAAAIDDKIQMIMDLKSGASLKIFPHTDKGVTTWCAPTGHMLREMQQPHYNKVKGMIAALHRYQYNNGGHSLPSDIQLKAEITYNAIPFTNILFIVNLSMGLLTLLYFIFRMTREEATAKGDTLIRRAALAILSLSFLSLTFCEALRWIISGTIPMSNGYETMLFVAWAVMLLSLLAYRRFHIILTFGFIMSGLFLLVSHISQMDPNISHIMPVLNSPLLTVHVSIIMISFALLSMTFICGVTGILIPKTREPLQLLSQLLLYPALATLGIGIFVGAIWANVSWGQYWSWDSKEVWALVTFMIYAIAVHTRTIPMLNKPLPYHIFMTLAFLTILMTYFGVNYFLGGMHSYA